MAGTDRSAVKERGLFQRFPLHGSALLSIGEVPVPYHVYDGRALMIGGVADFDAVREMLSGEDVALVRDVEGNALMAIWLCDFTRASLGPHRELQFSFFVARDQVAPVTSTRLGVLTALLSRPDTMMFCSCLWNDERRVVAYNRELLGLDARYAETHFEQTGATLTFRVTDMETGNPVLAGKSVIPRFTAAGAGWNLVREIGFLKLWRAARTQWLRLPVVNSAPGGLATKRMAETYSGSNANRTRYFDKRKDELQWGSVPMPLWDLNRISSSGWMGSDLSI